MGKHPLLKLASSPVIALSATVIAAGLVIVPFRLWGTDHAAQFYGSFSAATVAALAAFSGYFIQHNLTISRERRAEERTASQALLDLYFWLRHVESRFRRLVAGMDKKLNAATQPPNDTTPFFQFNAVEVRRMEFPDIEAATRARISAAFSLKKDLRFQVIESMYRLCEMAEDFSVLPKVDTEEKLDRKTLLSAKTFFEGYVQRMAAANEEFEKFLRDEKVF